MMRKSVRGLAFSGAVLVLSGCALLLAPGCEAGETDPVDVVGSEDENVGTAESAVLPTCIGTGDVGTVTAAIAANCGGVAGCTNTTTTHNDLKLTDPSKYCSCYEWLWSKRASAPYKNVQIIYHNAAAGQCGSNYHIHVQKKNGPGCATTCNNGMQGLIAMDLDTSPADDFDASGNPIGCTDNGGTYDRQYNCSCVATENKQAGACVNPGAGGGGGWNCASSSYNGVQYWTCSGGNLYKCVNGVPQTTTCANGCNVNAAGTDDTCKSAINWNCANSSYNGVQYWTCSGGNLYKCVNGVPTKTTCANGCNVNAAGTNDTCK